MSMTLVGDSLMTVLMKAAGLAYARGAALISVLDVFRAALSARIDVRSRIGPDDVPVPPAQPSDSNRTQDAQAATGAPPDRAGARAESSAALREASWQAAGDRPRAEHLRWDRQVRPAVEDAIDLAIERGQPWASGHHLFAALIAPFEGDVAKVLDRAGVPVDWLVEVIEGRRVLDRSAQPWTPIVDIVGVAGGLMETPWPVRALAAPYRAVVRPRYGWIGYALLQDARRQAVRLDHDTTNPVHLLVAAADLAEQLDAHVEVSQSRPRPPLIEAAGAGRRLRAGLSPQRPFAWSAIDLGALEGPVAERQPELRKDGPPFSASAVAAIDRASGVSRHGRLAVGPLMVSVLADPDTAVLALLSRAGLDLDTIRRTVADA